MVTAIVVAAGKSERMGGGSDKAFLNLGSKPVVAWSLLAFEKNPDVLQKVKAFETSSIVKLFSIAISIKLMPLEQQFKKE